MEITAAPCLSAHVARCDALTSPSVNEGNPMRCGYVIAPCALLAIFFRARVGNMSFCCGVP